MSITLLSSYGLKLIVAQSVPIPDGLYWGFATPKGGTAPVQKPKTVPSDGTKCLSFTTPTSAPTPSIIASEGASNGAVIGASTEKYEVYGRPGEQPVMLRGVDDLPPLKATGGIFGFGG